MKLSKYRLARWSVLVRERDDMECFMCKRECLKRREIRERLEKANGEHSSTMDFVSGLLGEAHHIRAKYHYPEKAYNLDNGITLCWRCHRQVVHSTYQTFRIYLHPFTMAMTRTVNREFNDENQRRV